MNSLQAALQRLAQLQRQSLDKHALLASIDKTQTHSPQKTLQLLKSQLNWKSVQWLNNASIDPSQLPCLAVDHEGTWRVVKSYNSQSQWVLESADGESTQHHLSSLALVKVDFRMPFDRSNSPVWHLIKQEIQKHQSTLIDASLNGVMLNFVALGISFTACKSTIASCPLVPALPCGF